MMSKYQKEDQIEIFYKYYDLDADDSLQKCYLANSRGKQTWFIRKFYNQIPLSNKIRTWLIIKRGENFEKYNQQFSHAFDGNMREC